MFTVDTGVYILPYSELLWKSRFFHSLLDHWFDARECTRPRSNPILLKCPVEIVLIDKQMQPWIAFFSEDRSIQKFQWTSRCGHCRLSDVDLFLKSFNTRYAASLGVAPTDHQKQMTMMGAPLTMLPYKHGSISSDRMPTLLTIPCKNQIQVRFAMRSPF